MLESHKIYLHDRIKETSYTIGTGNFTLNGAAHGFSSFGSVYANGANIFYAATDGSFYEVGSGIYVTGVQNSITRFPIKSTNNNAKVNFGEGLKEIFVTYPATNSVYTASGLQNHTTPNSSGLAFWSSSNIINYDPNIVWNSGTSKLGIKKSNPTYSIDIGGNGAESIIRSSGLYIGSSGILFPSGNNGDSSYIGGRQVTHYEANVIDNTSGLDEILELSGVAKNIFVLQQQNAGLVFAGPASGCTPPCSPDYPTFRPLIIQDIVGLVNISGIAQYGYSSSGLLRNDLTLVSGIARYGYNSSGVLRNDLNTVSGISYDSSGIFNTDISTVSGISYDISGVLSNDISTVSGLLPYFGTITNYDDPGSSGAIAFDSDFVYFNVPSGDSPTGLVWKKVAISIW
jgi:hypothetical protein